MPPPSRTSNITIQTRADRLKLILAVAIVLCAVTGAAAGVPTIGRSRTTPGPHAVSQHHAARHQASQRHVSRHHSSRHQVAQRNAARRRASGHRTSSQSRHLRRAGLHSESTAATILHPPPLTPRAATVNVEPPTLPLTVAYQEGLLAVTAKDTSLGEILEYVHESTGAFIDAPALDEHISVELLPRIPVQVIASLLEGMQLNYVIVGGTSEQDRLQSLIISKRPPVAEIPAIDVQRDTEARVRAAARFAEETGGDEGVWENGQPSSPEPTIPPGRSARD